MQTLFTALKKAGVGVQLRPVTIVPKRVGHLNVAPRGLLFF